MNADSQFEDYSFQQSLVAPESGNLAGMVLSEDQLFDPANLPAGPTGTFPFAAGSDGQAYNPITGEQLIAQNNGYDIVGVFDNVSAPIQNLTAIASYGDQRFFANDDNQFAVYDTTAGDSSIVNTPFSIGGMSAETAPNGDLIMVLGDCINPTLCQVDLGSDLSNPSFSVL